MICAWSSLIRARASDTVQAVSLLSTARKSCARQAQQDRNKGSMPPTIFDLDACVCVSVCVSAKETCVVRVDKNKAQTTARNSY